MFTSDDEELSIAATNRIADKTGATGMNESSAPPASLLNRISQKLEKGGVESLLTFLLLLFAGALLLFLLLSTFTHMFSPPQHGNSPYIFAVT
ncbi:MAG: hypothetical protein ACETV1_08875 [Candidatus Bathyarchaeia archaeon]